MRFIWRREDLPFQRHEDRRPEPKGYGNRPDGARRWL